MLLFFFLSGNQSNEVAWRPAAGGGRESCSLKEVPLNSSLFLLEVPLKQGRSLMDWIRLTKSGKDLTGLKGRLIEVTEEELKKHNKKDDCWICIRGR